MALAWGPDPEGVGDATLLARAAALGLHPDQFSFLLDSETTAPRVASPPFVEASKAFVALKASGPPGAEKFDADAARGPSASGEVALLIDRAERAATWGTEGSPIGTAPLPGSTRVYDFSARRLGRPQAPNRPSYLPHGGGWLVGVAASSPGRRRRPRTSPGTSPAPSRPTACGPRRASRCSPSGRRNSPKGWPTPDPPPASSPGPGPTP